MDFGGVLGIAGGSESLGAVFPLPLALHTSLTSLLPGPIFVKDPHDGREHSGYCAAAPAESGPPPQQRRCVCLHCLRRPPHAPAPPACAVPRPPRRSRCFRAYGHAADLVRAAEGAIKQQEESPGLAIALLQIVADASIPQTTRLAAALYFKNFIRRRWTVCIRWDRTHGTIGNHLAGCGRQLQAAAK